MTADERREFLKVVLAHERTVAVCEACAETTRDLAAEVKRGGMPATATADRHDHRGRERPSGAQGRSSELGRLKALLGD